MKNQLSLIIVLLLLGQTVLAQKDLIIFRDGTECQARVTMVNSDNTYYSMGKGGREESKPNTSIYMIKYEKRGNVFFTEQGEWYSSQDGQKTPRGATLIYLLEGKELIGYNLTMDASNVCFTLTSKSNNPITYIPKGKIFIIKYPDGTKDMLNDFESVRQLKEKIVLEEQRQEEERLRQEQAKRLPREVTITTNSNIVIKAELLAEEDDVIKYKKKNVRTSPVYTMKKVNIKELINN